VLTRATHRRRCALGRAFGPADWAERVDGPVHPSPRAPPASTQSVIPCGTRSHGASAVRGLCIDALKPRRAKPDAGTLPLSSQQKHVLWVNCSTSRQRARHDPTRHHADPHGASSALREPSRSSPRGPWAGTGSQRHAGRCVRLQRIHRGPVTESVTPPGAHSAVRAARSDRLQRLPLVARSSSA
jgi:hypothetical protein